MTIEDWPETRSLPRPGNDTQGAACQIRNRRNVIYDRPRCKFHLCRWGNRAENRSRPRESCPTTMSRFISRRAGTAVCKWQWIFRPAGNCLDLGAFVLWSPIGENLGCRAAYLIAAEQVNPGVDPLRPAIASFPFHFPVPFSSNDLRGLATMAERSPCQRNLTNSKSPRWSHRIER